METLTSSAWPPMSVSALRQRARCQRVDPQSSLAAFVYTSLVSTKKQAFLKDFGLDQKLQQTPAIITFAAAKSGRQLEEMAGYPKLRGLIRMLNSRLAVDGIAPLRFFVVENPVEEFATCLTTTNEANAT